LNDGEVQRNREKDVSMFGRDFDGIGAGVDLLAMPSLAVLEGR